LARWAKLTDVLLLEVRPDGWGLVWWSGLVSVDRRLRLWSLMVERAGGAAVGVEHAGCVAAAVAGVDTVAVVVTLAASPRESVYASSALGADLEELTTTLGEGPGVDALSAGPALAADLREAWCLDRWPMFAPAAVALIRLRAYAYAHEERLRDVAAKVVARRIRLRAEPPGGAIPHDDEGE
jgi:hypothetical protein